MKKLDNQRQRRIRRNNGIVLALLVIFVVAVFAYSFLHIGREARPDSARTTQSQP
jgi:flagellar basal body-associated protein FliL